MAFGPGRKAPIAAANQHCRQKSATPSCLGAAAARRVQSRSSSLPSSTATHASGRSQVQGRSVELRKCGSPVCREGAEMQEGPEKCRRAWRWCSCTRAVAVTCSASDALSLAEPASRLASLAAARELLMPLSLLQMVALRASSSASTAVTRTCHPRGLANRGLGKPSVAFWCRSESRNPPKPGADGRSMFACTASVVGPPASQRTPSSPQTDSRCSKSSPAERTGKP